LGSGDGGLLGGVMVEAMATQPTEVQMSSTDVRSESATQSPSTTVVEMKLEVVVVPVSDVDRAKEFYQKLGWRFDGDFPVSDDFRVVQMTPTGSACSIIFGAGITTTEPGSLQDLMLVVYDIEAARADLVDRGIEVSEIFHDEGGLFHHAGTTARVPGPDPEGRSYSTWASFKDPDGNGWLLQEIKTRLPGR
jgi:catechol 2,3-dioxygenase-like lactoylglutathione lyase family enzyme